ncbi:MULTISPECIES: uracil-DNA glycosylase family protein [Halococcus]|uniref:Uracil DNA glycosylase n=1 Tax=Halococcus salifodinae DSM 8989 TaxID=1227456 RepID=M0N084_9EURY|nr:MULTISPECIES: uracil-DNA glycosylase family protein [Halococcus]EMA50065.1 uracil DNA glycosylase [Halococcus salifodinae DSM 8989]
MQNVTDRTSNPFGMRPPCEQFVPGYGDANADFHVIGDHPGVHGGVETGVPFTNAAGRRLQRVLHAAGLLDEPDSDAPTTDETFFSYLHTCVADEPTPASYADCERFFDAELRAISAHVLLPVGERATRYVLEHYTARPVAGDLDMDALHATELRGGGWLVLPVTELADWTEDDADRLTRALETLLATDYRRETDLGRFIPGGDSYRVR